MNRAERIARKLTLGQIEKLALISSGVRNFHARAAVSITSLVDKELVAASFDLSEPDALRGRVHEIWRDVSLTPLGIDVHAMCLSILSQAQAREVTR